MSTSTKFRKQLLTLLDEEFVTLRGRKLSLRARYPDLFGNDGCADFHWLTQDEAPVSVLVTRPVQLGAGHAALRGALVGWVHTVRAHQGRGLASALLHAVAERMTDEGADFMLLWAHQHGYYRGQGYHVADATLLAEAATSSLTWTNLPVVSSMELALSSLSAAQWSQLQRLADQDGRGGVSHTLRDYRRIPLPFEHISLALAGSGNVPAAYVLLGHQPGWTTVLEGCGDMEALRGLVAHLCQRTANIRVNARRDSSLHRALADVLPWAPKPLAMYLPLTSRFDLFPAASWSFPYFDRM